MKFSDTVTQEKGNNINWINNLRLIAMFAVVVLHTSSAILFDFKNVSVTNWLTADIYHALVRFAVPVFVMITGALLLNKDYELTGFLKKRLGRLIPPFIFWSLVYIAYKWHNGEVIFAGNSWADIKTVLGLLQAGAFYHLWYVYELIGLYLFIPILSKFVRNATEREILYFLVIWLITILLGRPYLTVIDTAIDLHNFTGYVGYLVLGYYLANKEFDIKNTAGKALIVFVLFASVIAGGTYYLLLTKHDLNTFFYEPIGPFIMVLSASVYIVAKHTRLKLHSKIAAVCNNASKYTLGIYFCHALILILLNRAGLDTLTFTPLLAIPVVALSCFLLSWLLIFIMSKVPLLKHVTG